MIGGNFLMASRRCHDGQGCFMPILRRVPFCTLPNNIGETARLGRRYCPAILLGAGACVA